MLKNPVKIMIVEDEKLVRCGLKTIFETCEDFVVTAESETGKSAAAKAVESNPDIILVDLKLPDMSGIKLLSLLKNSTCSAKSVILSSHADPCEINEALSLGIYAYIIKDISEDLLINVIKTVYNGAMWFHPQIAAYMRSDAKLFTKQQKMSRSEFKNKHSNLTAREFEVLKLVVDGKSNCEIAQTLFISEHTAKAHVCNIIQKLLVEDRTQAAVKALKEGIIT